MNSEQKNTQDENLLFREIRLPKKTHHSYLFQKVGIWSISIVGNLSIPIWLEIFTQIEFSSRKI